MIRGKKAIINTVGTRIQKRKLGAATHLQASVAEEDRREKIDSLPMVSLSKDEMPKSKVSKYYYTGKPTILLLLTQQSFAVCKVTSSGWIGTPHKNAALCFRKKDDIRQSLFVVGNRRNSKDRADGFSSIKSATA